MRYVKPIIEPNGSVITSGSLRRKAMRIMGNEDGMGSLNRGALMEIEPASRRDVVDPAPEARRMVQALEAKLVEAPPQVPAEAAAKPARKRSGLGRLVFLAIGAVILGAASFYAYDWWTNGRFIVSTDDAYVGADAATIAPKISGYIKSVEVSDNEHVKAGDSLVVLDDADYRIALGQAGSIGEADFVFVLSREDLLLGADEEQEDHQHDRR